MLKGLSAVLDGVKFIVFSPPFTGDKPSDQSLSLLLPFPFLQACDLSAEDAQDKMRCMALLVVCSKAHGEPISFETIQTALDISESEVQPWIVRAIGAKLLEGKIDQVAGSVSVTKCHHRTFTEKEWTGLAGQLTALQVRRGRGGGASWRGMAF